MEYILPCLRGSEIYDSAWDLCGMFQHLYLIFGQILSIYIVNTSLDNQSATFLM